MPPPMAVRSKIAADLRPSADGSAVRTSCRWWLNAGSQRAYSLGSCAMGQTDGRMALFQKSKNLKTMNTFMLVL